VPAPAAAPPLPAAGGAAVQRLEQRHALKVDCEIGDGRQQAGGRGGARGHLVSIVSPISGGGAHPVFADDAGREEAVAAAAQQVLLCRFFDQVSPVVVQ